MIVILTYTGTLHVAWSRMGGQWGYQQFFSAAPTNRHSVCECTWLEGAHHSWRGTVAICVWECEPRVARCTWSPPPGMCLYLLSEPLTVQSWASLSQREGRLGCRSLLQTVQNPVLGFLHAAGGFPCAAHRTAVSQLAGRQVRLVLCVCLRRGLSPAVCLIPICSAFPLAGRFFSFAHHHLPDALPAPVRYLVTRIISPGQTLWNRHYYCSYTVLHSVQLTQHWCLCCCCSTGTCHL